MALRARNFMTRAISLPPEPRLLHGSSLRVTGHSPSKVRPLSTDRRASLSPVSTIVPASSPFSSSIRNPTSYTSHGHRPCISRLSSTSLPRSSVIRPDLAFAREFHSTPPRRDIFFVAFPALKGALLNVTRAGLLTLPFVWRWRLWKKYRRFSMILINIPIFAFCLVLALGLDQCPRTQRWRLLLMSESEELAWSRRKFDEVLAADGPLLLGAEDPRTERVSRVATRLITALEEQEQNMVHGATWPPRDPRDDLARVMAERERARGGGSQPPLYKPSATTHSNFMPFQPESSNPQKVLQRGDWNIWVVDSPKINAFALPSKDIFVYSGLVDLVDDDTLLSAVMAHEIAHVTQRHAVENLGFLNLAAVIFDVIRGVSFALTISFPLVTDSAGLFINWVNDVVASRAYSRKLEMEADEVGLNFMASAGYDPRAALDLWELMAAVEADAAAHGEPVSIADRFSLLQTHPTSSARQEAIAKFLPKALRIYSDSAKSGLNKTKTPTTSYLSRPVEAHAETVESTQTPSISHGQDQEQGRRTSRQRSTTADETTEPHHRGERQMALNLVSTQSGSGSRSAMHTTNHPILDDLRKTLEDEKASSESHSSWADGLNPFSSQRPANCSKSSSQCSTSAADSAFKSKSGPVPVAQAAPVASYKSGGDPENLAAGRRSAFHASIQTTSRFNADDKK